MPLEPKYCIGQTLLVEVRVESEGIRSVPWMPLFGSVNRSMTHPVHDMLNLD